MVLIVLTRTLLQIMETSKPQVLGRLVSAFFYALISPEPFSHLVEQDTIERLMLGM